MALQEGAQVGGGEESFANAQEKGFEVGGFGMAVSATIDRAALLPLLNDRPIKQGEEGAIVVDEGIMLQQSSNDGLVKEGRRRYDHDEKLLSRVDCCGL